MNQTYTLRNVAAVLLGRLRFIVICTILFGMAALLAARFWMPFHYEAYASMYVRADTERTGNVNLSDLNASKSLVSTYIAVLTSQTVMNEVSRQLCDTLDEATLWTAFPGAGASNPPDVLDCIKMNAVNSTEVMRITANTKSPEVSARICNILVSIAPEALIRVVGAGSVEVIDEAVPIYRPVSPNIPLVTLIGALAGLAAAVLLVLALDFFDDTVRDTEKLLKAFSRPILGEIQSTSGTEREPFLSRVRNFIAAFSPVKRKKRSSRPRRTGHRSRRTLITDDNIPFTIVEGYKSIRSNIVFALGTAERKAIVVSSASPHEGKSTTAANIALAFAQISGRVLLIDADMRKPVMHRTFVVDNSTGLSTLIIALSSVETSIRHHVMGNLDLLPSGPLPPNPSELLSSSQFQELLAALSERYDYVIIDTPPMNVVSDALVMRGVGGILLVARYAQATYEDIAEAMKKIDLSGGNMLGFVVNDVERHPAGAYYSRYGYRYGYGYGYGYGRRRRQTATAVTPEIAAANAALFADAPSAPLIDEPSAPLSDEPSAPPDSDVPPQPQSPL
ncbi:MAG: polysaccharide biosynthesis tyrosine autokinase [Oscillibacter sp.]|nr:polysaccharide biosynthesis tyrosine autokinase [Oscillibacter sp.]